jgi:transcriptional regulator with XRE-family HTH domain
LAGDLGITQQTYAGWERRTTALKPEYISKLAEILNVPVEFLLGHEDGGHRKGGSVGKAQRILGIVEDLLTAQRMSR